MINPYDLGEIVEGVQNVKINDLVRKARAEFKLQFIKSSLDISGVEIQLTTSETRFGGKRLWLVCPICKNRKGVIYTEPVLGCRICLNLKYRIFF